MSEYRVSVDTAVRGDMVYATATVVVTDSKSGETIHTISKTVRVNKNREDAEDLLFAMLKKEMAEEISKHNAVQQVKSTMEANLAARLQSAIDKVVSS